MGLLYPDHPDDRRPGLFDDERKRERRRSTRSPDRRYSRRYEDRAVRVPAETITTSTTSSGLRSLNDLMVRPPTKKRSSATRERRRPDEARDVPRPERKERPRRDREERERSPRKARPEEHASIYPDLASPRQERSPRKTERPARERRSSYQQQSKRDGESPRKRRPSYNDARGHSSYHDDAQNDRPQPRSPRKERRARFDETPVTDTYESIPAPPPFRRTSTAGTSDSSSSVATPAPATPIADGMRHETVAAQQAQSPVVPAQPTSPAAPSAINAAPRSPGYNNIPNHYQPGPPTADSTVSSYMESSKLEFGTPPERAYRRPSSDDTESDYFSRRGHRRDNSAWDEVEYYKYGQAPEDEPPRRRCCTSWSRRRKCITIFGIVVSLVVLIIIIAVAASLTNKFDYTPSTANVTNPEAFKSGGATRNSADDFDDGIGAGKDEYTYYDGPETNFPGPSKWISFQAMWNANLHTLQSSCGWLDKGPDNSPKVIQNIFDAIQSRANASLVDHRVIFATILQESNGCPHVGETESSGGVRNPGLMQSHNGHVYDPKHSKMSILQMIQDGTQGTEHGDGIVKNLNLYGNVYKAARGYNSGYIPKSSNLSEEAGATACYVSDMANRLTGWVFAESKCHE